MIIALISRSWKNGICLPHAAQTIGLRRGTFAFSDQMKKSGEITLLDVWGYMDSQETVGISPDMFDEFFFPVYKRISSLFGRLSYGCCEPVHNFWGKSLSKLTNLRKISISPWCDEEYMGDALRGKNIIYQRKPSPLFIGGTDYSLDEKGFPRTHSQNYARSGRMPTGDHVPRYIYAERQPR